MNNPLNEVMTVSEVMKRYDKSMTTIHHDIHGFNSRGKFVPPKFKEGEKRQAGKAWLLLKSAVERIYGKANEK